MNDDEGEVEADLPAVVGHGEIAAVEGTAFTILLPVPSFAVDDDLVDVVFGVVELAVHLVTAGDADIVLAAVAAHDKCYVLLHVLFVFLP